MRIGFVVPLVCFVFVALYGSMWPKLCRLDDAFGEQPQRQFMVSSDFTYPIDERKDQCLTILRFLSQLDSSIVGFVLGLSTLFSIVRAPERHGSNGFGGSGSHRSMWQKASSKYDAATRGPPEGSR